jgi:4-amino-4-deoxy-L-arabinose transferase-like glycosyltransferase
MTDRTRRWLLPATVALLALAACITSLGHDFTYDDRYVIMLNERVHSLRTFWRFFAQSYWPPKYGGDGYRPVVILLFTLQWVLGGGAAWVFHLTNILLAVATALAVYWMALALLPPAGAWIAAALFAVHPVHVEVTGNMVGQAELLVGLSVAVAMGVYLRRRRDGTVDTRTVGLLALLFGIALFSKEHGAVFPILLLVAEWTVVRDDRSWRERMLALRPLMLALVAVALLYFKLRSLVQEDLAGFAPYAAFRFLNMGAAARIGTMMHEFPRIAQLMLFPTRLSADYSPNDVIIANGIGFDELPGILLVGCTLFLAFALRRRAPVASFGLFWFIVAYGPVSNVLVPTGIVTAERTLFLPSVGIVLVAAVTLLYLLDGAERRTRLAYSALAGLLLVLGLGKSIVRQRVWHDNDILFDETVRDAPLSYRAHLLRGRNLAVKKRLREAEVELRHAIRIFPYDAGATVDIAEAYRRSGMCKPAVPLYEWSFAIDSTLRDGRLGYVYCLSVMERWQDTREQAFAGMRYGFSWEGKYLRNAVFVADSALGRPLRKRPPI